MSSTAEFTVYLVSSASMDLFPDNTMASFRTMLRESLNLDGEWRVALSEITYPSFIRNVTNGVFRAFKNYEVEENGQKKWNERVQQGEEQYIPEGWYPNPQDLLDQLALFSLLDFEPYINEGDQLVRIKFKRPGDGITFTNNEIPSLLGLESEKDYHSGKASIGYQNQERNAVFATHPADMTAGTQLLFVYLDIIEYQAVGDTKAPLLQVIAVNRTHQNSQSPLETLRFTNLDFKKLLSHNIQTMRVELRTETGQLVPFEGTGKVLLTLKFKSLN